MQNLLDIPTNTGLSTEINVFLIRAFNWAIDFVFTQISIVFDFLLRPEVLGTLAWLGVIYIAYRWIKSKSRSI